MRRAVVATARSRFARESHVVSLVWKAVPARVVKQAKRAENAFKVSMMTQHSIPASGTNWCDELRWAVGQIPPVRRHFYVYTVLLLFAVLGGKLDPGCNLAQFEDDPAQVDAAPAGAMSLDHQSK